MKEKGAVRGLLATMAVIALLSAALGGAYSLSKKSWNEGWSLETLESNVDFVADAFLFGWDGGAWDNHSMDNLPADNSSPDNASDLGFWDTHDLDAIPVVQKNASVEDLPTAEEVENILFEWDVFENKRPPVVIDWTPKTFDGAFSMVKKLDLEYHFDENDRLHVDTPGWVFETPSERDENEYIIGNLVMENGGGSRNALDFCRHLKKQGILSGIAIFHITNAYPQAKVVVPVESGLMYSCHTGTDWGTGWTGIWSTTNVKPEEHYPWWEVEENREYRITETDVYWRLGEGDYVEWDYVLRNGEPTMVWPENDQPVGWRTST